MTSCPNSHRNHIESNAANKPTQQSVIVTTTNTELKKHPLILPDIKMSKSKNGSTEAVINGDVVILAARHFQQESTGNDEDTCEANNINKFHGTNKTSEVKFDSATNKSLGHQALNKQQSMERLQNNIENIQVTNLKLRQS